MITAMAQEGQRQLGMNRETSIAVTILCALAGVPLVIAGLVHLSGLHRPAQGLGLIALGSLVLLVAGTSGAGPLTRRSRFWTMGSSSTDGAVQGCIDGRTSRASRSTLRVP
jgi:hypothetical protein